MAEAEPCRKKTRCLGLIAGLGVGSAIHYYKKLALATERHDRVLDMVMVHAQTARVFEYVDAGDRDGLTAYLDRFIVRLRAAGAEFVVIPAVTPHFCIRELRTVSPLPVLSIFEPLNRELAARKIRRVSVFGSTQVMQSALYSLVENTEIIPAQHREFEYIRETYLKLLGTGLGTEEQHRELTALAHTIIERDRVDAIILAGTDLALVFNENNTDFPYLDCAALHLEAIKDALLHDSDYFGPQLHCSKDS
jgi:aspartate racemase